MRQNGDGDIHSRETRQLPQTVECNILFFLLASKYYIVNIQIITINNKVLNHLYIVIYNYNAKTK